MLTSTEAAWAAGVFEGEGWVTEYTSMRLSVQMCDRDIIERLRGLFGGAIDERLRDGRKDSWVWRVTGGKAYAAAAAIYPFAGDRRKRALHSAMTFWLSLRRSTRRAA